MDHVISVWTLLLSSHLLRGMKSPQTYRGILFHRLMATFLVVVHKCLDTSIPPGMGHGIVLLTGRFFRCLLIFRIGTKLGKQPLFIIFYVKTCNVPTYITSRTQILFGMYKKIIRNSTISIGISRFQHALWQVLCTKTSHPVCFSSLGDFKTYTILT